MENAENWVSLREFARKREVSLKAVQKAIETGRVTAVKRDDNGRLTGIEMHAATAQWNRNTDPDQAGRAGQAPTIAKPGELPLEPPAAAANVTSAPSNEDASPAAAASSDDASTSYLASRARRSEIEAKTSELEYAKALGQLVSSADLRTVNGRRYRALRDMLLNIPDRIATVVAAERDPARVHAAMTAEIKRVLNELSDDAAAEVAARTAQRVAA